MSDEPAFDVGRLARILTLIAVVTAIFLLTASWQLEGATLQVGAVAIGAVAVVTAITGFLIAGGAAYDEAQRL
ncbi:hypothetical protein [Salinarchaeum sp. Harcht-Bsk1]|uniref:hypothetical protein n=1 Tax=Salinarchaeum sp. Harcht-Bsk1 TaxID=1333523 RepID=UPI001F45489C|nr:hypothetical protein [Salinarchaeum sp. Harcht-Bsk1]